jgi:hypothetical protein
VGNNTTNATDPSGLEVRLYKREVGAENYHVTVMVYDPVGRRVVLYDGGGSVSSGTESAHPNKVRHPETGWHPLAHDQTPDNYYKSRYGDRKVSAGIVIPTGKTVAEELDILDKTFARLHQLPYRPAGPNSNTFAHQLIRLAGFPGPSPSQVSDAPGWGFWTEYEGYGSLVYDEWGNRKSYIRPSTLEKTIEGNIKRAEEKYPRCTPTGRLREKASGRDRF